MKMKMKMKIKISKRGAGAKIKIKIRSKRGDTVSNSDTVSNTVSDTVSDKKWQCAISSLTYFGSSSPLTRPEAISAEAILKCSNKVMHMRYTTSMLCIGLGAFPRSFPQPMLFLSSF